ncbi:MAG: hypothetical protein ACM3XO_22535 [Bacteroidota bacterium]
MLGPQGFQVLLQGGLFFGVQGGEGFQGGAIIGVPKLDQLRRRVGKLKGIQAPVQLEM